MALQKIVGFLHRALPTQRKVVTNQWTHSREVLPSKKNLFVVATKNLIADVQDPGCDIDPHEGKVPLQCTAQPATDRERFRPVQQIFLRYFGPKTWEGTEDLQSASYQHEKRDGVNPVAKAYYEGVLVDCRRHCAGLHVLDRNRVSGHAGSPCYSP